MNDNTPKKDKVKAGIISLLVHAAIVLLLAILTLSVAHPDKDKEDGVPVLLGMVEDAGGEDLGGLPADVSSADSEAESNQSDEAEVDPVPVAPPPAPAAKPEPKPTPAPKPQPAKPLITQDQEKSIAAEQAKKAEEAKKKAAEEARLKAEAEAKRKAAEEAARKKAAEEAAKKRAAEEARRKAEEEARKKAEADRKAAAAANNRVAGAFGSGNKGNSGNTTGNGAQGSPTGNSNTGATTGTGGTGSGYEGNRKVIIQVDPSYPDDVQDEGEVVVSIEIDPAGNVVNPKILKSQTSSAFIKNAAIAAANKWKFSKDSHSDTGKITFRFFHKKKQ